MPVVPSFPTSTLSVRPWPDPVIDQVGHDPRSPYVEQFWLGIMGPTATWLLRRLAAGLEAAPAGYELDLATTAAEIGLGGRTGPQSPFLRSIARCCRFGAADLVDDTTLRVRRKLPPLSQLQLARLPESLQEAHRDWTAEHAPSSGLAVDRLRNRARHLALSLLELGEDGEATERQLHRWHIHPAMAHDATAWAVARHRAAHAESTADVAGTAGAAGDPPTAA